MNAWVHPGRSLQLRRSVNRQTCFVQPARASGRPLSEHRLARQMKPGGLERDRIGRETRQSILDQRAGEGMGQEIGMYEIGRDYDRSAAAILRAWHVASPQRP